MKTAGTVILVIVLILLAALLLSLFDIIPLSDTAHDAVGVAAVLLSAMYLKIFIRTRKYTHRD